MDFRVKKLILEEGMKNIAETEGVKLNMNFDDYHKTVEVEFEIGPDKSYSFEYVRHTCSYDSLENPYVNVFATIEKTRQEVHNKKYPTAASFMAGVRNYADITIPPRHGKSMTFREIIKSGGINAGYGIMSYSKIPKIKNVIFNYPATIVFWADGDKTVVKCQNDDVFDPEKGLAMAIIKKMNGGKGNYCEIFKPWIEKYDEKERETLERVIAGIAERWPNGFEYLVPQGAIDAQKDLEDILEGKVDPLMIKVDEEPKLDKGEAKGCSTCKYECKDCMDEPCHACILASSSENASPNWEPKEEKIVVKGCATCVHDETRRSEERPKPCDYCISKCFADGSTSDPSQWEPKE